MKSEDELNDMSRSLRQDNEQHSQVSKQAEDTRIIPDKIRRTNLSEVSIFTDGTLAMSKTYRINSNTASEGSSDY